LTISLSPKFYLFDTGVKRALDRTLDIPLRPGTYAFGRAFEHFVILEMHRLNSYFRKNFRFYHLLTKDGAEIDLLIERPGKPLALVEIKSADEVSPRHIRTLERFAKEMSDVEAFCLSRDPQPRRVDSVQVLPWAVGLDKLGLSR
jgi:predicted AAA+ superfamily ATPase